VSRKGGGRGGRGVFRGETNKQKGHAQRGPKKLTKGSLSGLNEESRSRIPKGQDKTLVVSGNRVEPIKGVRGFA